MRAFRRLLTVAATLLCLSTAFSSAAMATGNDYPYRTYSSNVADRWGFTVRQCVSFVAWREAQAGRPMSNAAQHWGNASSWDAAAGRLGVRISTRPVVGAIAQWHANERSAWYANGSTVPNGTITAGPYGHVAWVKYVYGDGSVLIEQYNMFGSRSYSTMRVRAPRYLLDGVAGHPAARRY